jgi:hypothetical protein
MNKLDHERLLFTYFIKKKKQKQIANTLNAR